MNASVFFCFPPTLKKWSLVVDFLSFSSIVRDARDGPSMAVCMLDIALYHGATSSALSAHFTHFHDLQLRDATLF